MGRPRQKRRAGHPKRAQWLRRDRLEKLLALLRAHEGRLTLSKLRSYHSFPRWEVKNAELLGWVRIAKGPRLRSGPRPMLVWPEEDTSKARPPAEEWEVPFVIPDTHRAFAARTLDIVGYNGRRGGIPIYKSVVVAYREAHAGCHGKRPSHAYQMLKRGDVQAVRAWLLAQSIGVIDADEEMPATVEEIEFRLRGAGFTDAQFDRALTLGRRPVKGRKLPEIGRWGEEARQAEREREARRLERQRSQRQARKGRYRRIFRRGGFGHSKGQTVEFRVVLVRHREVVPASASFSRQSLGEALWPRPLLAGSIAG